MTAAPDPFDLGVIGEAEQVEVVDALLVEHRLAHRQRVLVDTRPAAVAVQPVDEASDRAQVKMGAGSSPKARRTISSPTPIRSPVYIYRGARRFPPPTSAVPAMGAI